MALELTNEEIKLYIERITGNKDFLYIIQPYGMASVLISGGLSHAVQARKNKTATVLLLSDSLKNIGLTWENVTSIKYFPVDTMELFNKYFFETQDWEGENFIYGNFHQETPKPDAEKISDSDTAVSSSVEIKSDVEKSGDKKSDKKNDFVSKLNIIDQFKEKILDLPLDTEFHYPIPDKISDENAAALHEKYILDKNKTVVICPYFDYSPLAAVKFWTDFTKTLTDKGYIVYTNIQEIYQAPIEGTLPLNVSFAEMHYIADKVKCFAGIRNGVFDFIAVTDAKILSVETFPLWQQNLKILYPKCHARTFYNTDEILFPIRKLMAESNTGAKFELHHEKINDEDIFYTQKSILNALLDSVQKD